MRTILDTILVDTRERVAAAKRLRPLERIRDEVPTRERSTRVRDRLIESAPAIIAEVKRGSPSRGRFEPEVDPVATARAYARGAAEVISVVTDEPHFFALPGMFASVRREVGLPLLAKDFFVDPYQIYAAALDGADLVLLIVAALGDDELSELHALATSLGLEVLVETHDEAEVRRALAAGASIIGVNHRDLRTFEVDLSLTERLAPLVGEGCALVAESGIHEPGDVARLLRAGAHAFLVGESLVTHGDPARRIGELRAAGKEDA